MPLQLLALLAFIAYRRQRIVAARSGLFCAQIARGYRAHRDAEATADAKSRSACR